MTHSPNRHQRPTSLDPYVCEYALKAKFWLLGAVLVVYTIATVIYMVDGAKADEAPIITRRARFPLTLLNPTTTQNWSPTHNSQVGGYNGPCPYAHWTWRLVTTALNPKIAHVIFSC